MASPPPAAATPRPAPAPRQGRDRDPVADWARSGLVPLTGHADGPPLVPPGRAATRAVELAGCIAEATGGRVRIDGPRLLSERAAFTGYTRRGDVSVGGSARLLPTADGWAAVSCARPDDVMLLGALVGEELPTDPWPTLATRLRRYPGNELAELAELLGVAAGPVRLAAVPPALPPPPDPRAGRPVAGLLVVDFSALWAGPLCAHILGLAGARVVKVETPGRPDGARLGHPEFYRLLHGGHRSVVLDPADPAGRRALAALVAAADIVVEASRQRALAGFGLDARASAATGTTWISLTAAGRDSNRVGFGDDVAACAGLVAADPAGRPVFCGDAIADPLGGLTAAALVLTSPAGTLLDVGMSDVIAATLTPPPAGAAVTARRVGDAIVVDAAGEPVPVSYPRRRRPVGYAPPTGADTVEVLGELRIPAP